MVRASRGPPDTRSRRDDPRARWRAPLGLARNHLPAQQNRRNAAAELNLDIDVPIQARNHLPAQQNRRNAAAELNLDIDVPIQGFVPEKAWGSVGGLIHKHLRAVLIRGDRRRGRPGTDPGFSAAKPSRAVVGRSTTRVPRSQKLVWS